MAVEHDSHWQSFIALEKADDTEELSACAPEAEIPACPVLLLRLFAQVQWPVSAADDLHNHARMLTEASCVVMRCSNRLWISAQSLSTPGKRCI